MDLSAGQMESFIAVAEEGHVGRAARRLSMTQPPLSRKIQKLERDLGVALFRRNAAGMSLTVAGEQFLEDAYRIVALIDASRDRARMEGRDAEGTVTVGFTALSTYRILPKLLKITGAYMPNLSVRIAERVSPVQVDLISKGRLDIGFIRPQELPTGIVHTEVDRTPIIAIIPEKHPVSRRQGPLTVTDLAELTLVRYDHYASPYLAWLHDGAFASCTTNAPIEVSQVLSGAAVVAEGIGAMLVPAAIARFPLPGITHRRIQLPEEYSYVPTWAVYAEGARSPLADKVLERIDELRTHLARTDSELIRSLS